MTIKDDFIITLVAAKATSHPMGESSLRVWVGKYCRVEKKVSGSHG